MVSIASTVRAGGGHAWGSTAATTLPTTPWEVELLMGVVVVVVLLLAGDNSDDGDVEE